MKPSTEAALRAHVLRHNEELLNAYAAHKPLVIEHHGIEQTVMAGGYGYRQVLELVQNGADAILEKSESAKPDCSIGRVQVLLRSDHLYVANTGAPLSLEGVSALLSSHASPKRGNQIGRFGLGFKSLLALGGTIDLFTRTAGAIRLDPARCRREILERFQVANAPSLRLAWPLEAQERLEDRELVGFEWAETIVRVRIDTTGTIEHLRQEIQSFPPEFLLFFPVPLELGLDDGDQPARVLGIEHDGSTLVLREGQESSRWRVATSEARITDPAAIVDATHVHARNSVPVSWAVPLDRRREEAGRFWAFFPTQTPTYMRGILNAPWKLNSDRNAIVGGAWNRALMREAAQLIVETMPLLRTDEDPALPLDAFPRKLERLDEDAAPLVEAVWTALETARVIPDVEGTLRSGEVLLRHPRESEGLARQWLTLAKPGAAAGLVHPKCNDRQRAARLEVLAHRLVDRPGKQSLRNLKRCTVETWFGSVGSSEPDRAIQVLRLAKAYAAECNTREWEEVRHGLKLVPDVEGNLRVPSEVMLAPEGARIPGLALVDHRIQADAETRSILLNVLGVRPLSDGIWDDLLERHLDSTCRHIGRLVDKPWKEFWITLRQAPRAIRTAFILANRARIRARRLAGSWAGPGEVLLPGAIVSRDDDSASRNVLVDMDTHSGDLESLSGAGICAVPEGTVGPGNYVNVVGVYDIDFKEWLHFCRDLYKKWHTNQASWDYLQPGLIGMPAGFRLLPKLEGLANARLTGLYLDRLAQGEFQGRIKFGHSTTSTYAKIDVDHPLPWFILRYGSVEFDGEVVRLSTIVDRRASPVWAMVPGWTDGRGTVIEKLGTAVPPVASTLPERKRLWLSLYLLLSQLENDGDLALSVLWRDAAADDFVPPVLPGDGGEVSLSNCYVTTSRTLARRVRLTGRLVIALDEATREKWLIEGARDLTKFVRPEWAAEAGPINSLSAILPELAEVLVPDLAAGARGLTVSGLRLRMDGSSDPVPCLAWNETLLLDVEQLAALSRIDRLKALLDEISAADLLSVPFLEALDLVANRAVDDLRAAVRAAVSLPERLLLAVGGRREPLISALGPAGQIDVVQACTNVRLAEIVLSHLGPTALVALQAELEAEGLRPPHRWNGATAKAFVTAIGFPDNFAGSPEARRDPEEMITGPIALPPLHDFQIEVFEGVKSLLGSGGGRRRAVVSLPTGGGKTRVTVEAAVRLVLEPSVSPRSVLWVAQTDELCEQAVQAFRQVWINLGAERTELRLVRLWGGSPNPSRQDSSKPVVVVASIQTLNSRFSAKELAWLRKPGLVVVDECHHAITPSYSNLLRWLDSATPKSGASVCDEPPILGLSATPFRTDDYETSRLARRFDSRWLPNDQEALYERLRVQGVLAEPVYERLESGSALLPEESERLARLATPWEGLDFDKILEAINQRLAGDAKRNDRLVEYLQNSKEQSILFFANSVTHAQEMAVRLNLGGVPAAAVSGGTPSSARRDFLEQFQNADVRVLCNHSVLTTGFDAPKTDMVLIARQVFSPGHYMQMVGRGLRGEKNGGTARCRIVTVLDNLGRFQERHPYHYCRQYFETQAAKTT